jgi:NAD(P)-dependent dehydrogenase (short-subunit alcohol dehydrogenase family)
VALPFELDGRLVVVTGGGGHLGRAIALSLSSFGATVIVCGRTAAPLQRVVEESNRMSQTGLVAAETVDIREQAEVEALIVRVQDRFGPLYGWVNNAYEGRTGSLMDATSRDIETILATGLTAVMMATQAAARALIESQTRGSIVNIASMYGLVAPRPHLYSGQPGSRSHPAYGASKAGLLQFTRYAACELAPSGIRVNALSPGAFPNASDNPAAFVERLAARVPLGRVGDPAEIGPPVTFLISQASSYVTGTNLVVDGGWTAW